MNLIKTHSDYTNSIYLYNVTFSIERGETIFNEPNNMKFK